MSDVEMAARSTLRASEVDPRRSLDGPMPGADNVICYAEHLRFPFAFHGRWCWNLFNDLAVFPLTTRLRLTRPLSSQVLVVGLRGGSMRNHKRHRIADSFS
ncbi:MAG TPA: hypothetical protein VNQ50_05395 [Xanthobacteraceae bacterium]|nr:hypothetical protein [Xanthobacteraceae bacterium]